MLARLKFVLKVERMGTLGVCAVAVVVIVYPSKRTFVSAIVMSALCANSCHRVAASGFMRSLFRPNTDTRWFRGLETQDDDTVDWRLRGTAERLIRLCERHVLPLAAMLHGLRLPRPLCPVQIHRQLHLRSIPGFQLGL